MMVKLTEEQVSLLSEAGHDLKPANFGRCIMEHAAPEDDPHVTRARELYARDGEIEFDDEVVLSESESGKYVMAWVWVGDDDL